MAPRRCRRYAHRPTPKAFAVLRYLWKTLAAW
jgi:hypothetical protein